MPAVKPPKKILLTGATGFIGSELFPLLSVQDYDVLCASRNPEEASKNHPDRDWIELDLHKPDTVRNALKQCDAAYYLVHEMSTGSGYRERERNAAETFIEVADEVDLDRLVYLGGVAPQEEPSEHLKSRLATGEILRSGETSAFELRASMIIGEGSASWRIVRDLAARLPAMILPSWTQSRSQPVHISDVTKALIGALQIEDIENGWYDIPGPDTLSIEEILRQTAEILNNYPVKIRVPLLSPKLSSYWLRFVTRSNYHVARELVEGLKSDLLAEDDRFWTIIEHQDRVPFKRAVRETIRNDSEVSLKAKIIEGFVRKATAIFG